MPNRIDMKATIIIDRRKTSAAVIKQLLDQWMTDGEHDIVITIKKD